MHKYPTVSRKFKQNIAKMLSALIINLIKSIFGSFFGNSHKAEVELSEREKSVFSTKLDARKKDGWIERIDYWIDKENYSEAVKLCNYYTDYFGFNDEITKRITRVNNLIKKQN